jgi:hypothetical protein
MWDALDVQGVHLICQNSQLDTHTCRSSALRSLSVTLTHGQHGAFFTASC